MRILGSISCLVRIVAVLATLLTSPLATASAAALTEAEARSIGVDAYVFGYPLVTMEMTRRISTNVAAPEGTRAPMGNFVLLRSYPSAKFRDVTAPNADTLYTVAWLDVSKEPWIIDQPDMAGRYFLMPMLDGWTDVFAVPGSRTTGTGPQKYGITGPGWKGKLPADVTEYKSPTGLVWLLGRIYCTGTPEDYAAVHALQDRFSAVPLSAFGKPFAAPAGKVDPTVDMKKAVREQVEALDAAAFFGMLAELMKANPPAPADGPMLARLAKIGIVPGKSFDPAAQAPAVAKALASAPADGQAKIKDWFNGSIAAGDAKLQNGWLFSTKTGVYGTDYIQRAFVTAIGLGANRPQDAIYPTSEEAAPGVPYSGANRYMMHFAKDKLPPVKGFWSVTLYDADYFFYDNPLNRYNLSQRNPLKKNPDGSVDLYIQHESPGKELESNWLPAPAERFILMLRMYWPEDKPPSILDGSWTIPAVAPAAGAKP